MVLLVLFFLLSITFSFLCSIWEAVLLSIIPSYVSRMQKERPTIGKLLSKYKEDVDRPLSAILTLNTIAHTVGAIGVGVQAGKLFGNNIINLGFVEVSYESIIAGLMTLAILIFSEIVPKTVGATYWKQLTVFTVQSLRILMVVLAPFVWLSKWITQLIKSDKDKSIFSRADFAAMADVGLKSGVLDNEESSIIQNLLKLEKIRVRDIMTPRSVIMMVDEQLKLEDIYKQYKPLDYSRIPVFANKQDNITGLILKDDILRNLAEDQYGITASAIKRNITFVEDSSTVAKLLNIFISTRQHLAVVADRYGSIVGLVTMEDLFETLLGLEIVDETDKVEDLQKLARKNWVKKIEENKKSNE